LEGSKLISAYKELDSNDQLHSDELLKTLVSGMKWDLKTYANASVASPTYGCRDAQAFDWYCYTIAGCVGPYWVRVFGLPSSLEALAGEYGKGLQRINILRDVVEDWNRGRVYLSEKDLSSAGSESQPWKKQGWSTFMKSYLEESRMKLRHGAHFCDAIPKSQWRLRWASMMPLLIGIETLNTIEREKRFSDKPMKISRKQVKRLAWKALTTVVLRRSISKRAELRV